MLARQVEIEGAAVVGPRPSRTNLSTAERTVRLNELLEGFGITELFDNVRDVFREHWPSRREYIGPTAVGFHLLESAGVGVRALRSFARIESAPDTVRIVFYSRTINLCSDDFTSAKEVIEHQTYRSPNDTEGEYESLIFPLTSDAWDTHREALTTLLQSVYAAWEESRR